jgi:hypothetical protein
MTDASSYIGPQVSKEFRRRRVVIVYCSAVTLTPIMIANLNTCLSISRIQLTDSTKLPASSILSLVDGISLPLSDDRQP